ncbi:MAG: AMP-binding protein [Acidimicrobiales bacterium]
MTAPRWRAGTAETVVGLLDRRADEHPDRPYLIVDGRTLTYGELQGRAVAAAGALERLGVGPGDAVAVFADTCPEWLDTWFGAALLGAVTVPVNTAFRGEFLANPLRDSRCRLALVDDRLAGRLAAVADELPELETVLVHRTADGGEVGGGWRTEDAGVLAEGGPGGPRRPRRAEWRDPSCVLYTSGTTGPSKGAVITQGYLVAAASAMVASWQLGEGEVLYAPLPLFHISMVGSVAGPAVAGGVGVLDARFSVRSCWDRVRQHGVHGILLAGVMLNMLWNLPEDDADAEMPLRFISAAPIPRGLHRPIEQRYHVKLLTSYGMTEAFPMTVYGVDDEAVEGASGRPQPNFEVVVLDADDRPLPPGEVGEICCRPTAPQVMFDGYHGRPATTVERWRNLWFHTGDLGRMDEGGNLTYVDRSKDAMRRRGENISSFEVEQTLLRHPAVAEAAAVGVPSELGEDDVKVVVALKASASLGYEELMDFCVERLPYFAVPRYVELVDQLPVNPTGKVLKTELRAQGVTPATWDRERAGYVLEHR